MGPAAQPWSCVRAVLVITVEGSTVRRTDRREPARAESEQCAQSNNIEHDRYSTRVAAFDVEKAHGGKG